LRDEELPYIYANETWTFDEDISPSRGEVEKTDAPTFRRDPSKRRVKTLPSGYGVRNG
jgi:hypothetical protein